VGKDMNSMNACFGSATAACAAMVFGCCALDFRVETYQVSVIRLFCTLMLFYVNSQRSEHDDANGCNFVKYECNTNFQTFTSKQMDATVEDWKVRGASNKAGMHAVLAMLRR